MLVVPRPSKTFWERQFFADVARLSDCPISLDIACGPLKYTDKFGASTYIGSDISFEALKSRTSRHAERIQADVRMPPFKPNSFDLVVSTNTLTHLPPEEVLPAVAKLYSLVRPNGHLLFTARTSTHCSPQSVKELLGESFCSVKVMTYRSSFLRFVEPFVVGAEGRRFVFARRTFRFSVLSALSDTLASLESFFSLFGFGTVLYVVGETKK